MRRCRRKGQWMSKHSSRSSAGGEPTCDAGDPGPIPGSGRYLGEGKGSPLQCSWASLVAQMVKNLPATRETQVRSLGWEDPLEKGKAAHSSVLAWRIPWTEEPGGLQGREEADRTERLSTAHSIETIQEETYTEKGLKGISLVAQWLRILPASAGNTGSIPGPEARVPLAERQLSPRITTTKPPRPRATLCSHAETEPLQRQHSPK